MTEVTNPATGAQPTADANSIDAIVDNAALEQTAPANDGKKPEAELVEQDADKQEPETPFPKKAINALSRRDKQIGKLRAEREHLAAELNKMREESATRQAQSKPNGAPSEKDFTNYADFLEAKNNYAIEQKFAEHAKKTETTHQQTQQTQQAAQYAQWEAQRLAMHDKQLEGFAKEYPDIGTILNENAELIASFSPQLKHAFLQADNASMAVYNLAKDGKLYDLPDMSLEDARVEIRLAQMKAAAKPQSKAPAPMAAARGSVAASKSPVNMSDAELRSWMNSET